LSFISAHDHLKYTDDPKPFGLQRVESNRRTVASFSVQTKTNSASDKESSTKTVKLGNKATDEHFGHLKLL